VATGKRTSVKEMVVFDGCTQSLLAPDGRTMVCAGLNTHQGFPRVSLRLIDVESGNAIYDKPGFFEPPLNSGYLSIYLLALEALSGINIAEMQVSPDGRYLVVAVGTQIMAYDLEFRRPVVLHGKLNELVQSEMCFLGPDQLYVVTEVKGKALKKAQILSFPDGALLKEAEIGDQQIESVTKGRLLTARPVKDFAVAILDPNDTKFIGGGKLPALDVWDNFVATEEAAGGLVVGQIGIPGRVRILLPLGPLPVPRAAVFSPDGKYLAVSLKNRAEIWDLDTGKQIALMRPFRSAWIDDADHLFGEFPKFRDKDASEAEMTMTPLTFKDLTKFEEQDWQYHELQYRYRPMGKEKSSYQHATIEVKNMQTQAVAWSRDFPHETPACWSAEDDRLVLAWDLASDTAKTEIKSHPNLQHEIDALKNTKKGLLIETVVPETGAPLQQVVIPEADLSGGLHDSRRARVSGDYMLVQGEHGNTAIYTMDSGVKVGEFFGAVVAADAGSHLIAAVNREGEMILVDDRDGKEVERFNLGSPIRMARIVINKEKALMALTADQVVHRLPLPQ